MNQPALRWRLSDGVRERARRVAGEIGERLLVEVRLPDAEDPNFERFANKYMSGPVGYALAFLALATATGDPRYERAMHEQLQRAARSPDVALGLFNGVSGMRAVAALATAVEPRYHAFVERCDSLVAAAEVPQGSPPQWYNEYDVIFGWSGIRLGRCIGGAAEPDRVTRYLGWLLEDDDRLMTGYPLDPSEPPQHWLGMAHGIAGILATLAITLAHLPDGLSEKMSRAARALASRVRDDGGRRAWPRAAEDSPGEPCRCAWCVGAAGIGAALLQVGRAIADAELEAFARDVLAEAAARSSADALTVGQGMCHGTVGNAAIFFSAARQTGEEIFERACERLAIETMDGLEAQSGRCISIGADGVAYDAIGELNGVAGIAVALLTMAGDFNERWLRIHALGF